MALPVITNNSPAAGSIAWTAFGITFNGVQYPVAAGNTANKYVYWQYSAGTPVLVTTDQLPASLAPEDYFLFLNKGGIGMLVDTAQVMDGSMIVNGSIYAAAIAANQINADHIQAGAVSASEIAANAIGADHVAAGAITAEKLSVGTVSDNMIVNGSFEDALTGNIVGWEASAQTNGTIAPVTGVSSSGAVSIRFDATATTANLALRQKPAQFIPVSSASGRKYYVSIRAGVSVATTAGAYLRVNWYDGSKVLLGTGGSTDVLSNAALTTTFSIYEGQVVPPAAARYMGIEVLLTSPSAVTQMFLDEVTAHEVTMSAQIGDGQITAPKIVAGAITADKIDANAINGKTITGATVQTAASGARVVLNDTGLYGWDANNINYLTADATGLTVDGTLQATGEGEWNNLPFDVQIAIGSGVQRRAEIETQQWPPYPADTGQSIPGLAFKPSDTRTVYHYAGITSFDSEELQLSGGLSSLSPVQQDTGLIVLKPGSAFMDAPTVTVGAGTINLNSVTTAISGDTTIDDDLTVNLTTTLQGNTTINGTTTHNANITLASGVTVNGMDFNELVRTQVTWANGWSNFGSGYGNLQAKEIVPGTVLLQGMAKAPATGRVDGGTIATLPVALRPTKIQNMPLTIRTTQAMPNANQPGLVQIHTDGTIKLFCEMTYISYANFSNSYFINSP